MDARQVAEGLTPLQISALIDCCKRGGTRTNDGGLVDTLLSGMCCKPGDTANGWLVTWSLNPASREDGYISLYTPTPLGEAVRAHLLGEG